MRFFKQCDTDHDGMISKQELEEICQKTDIQFDTKGFLEMVDVNKD